MTASGSRSLPVAGLDPSDPAAGPVLTSTRRGWLGVRRDRSGPWLRNAAVGLCVLAAAAAAVSFTAQYRMAETARIGPDQQRSR